MAKVTCLARLFNSQKDSKKEPSYGLVIKHNEVAGFISIDPDKELIQSVAGKTKALKGLGTLKSRSKEFSVVLNAEPEVIVGSDNKEYLNIDIDNIVSFKI